jgi:hypothetical protein
MQPTCIILCWQKFISAKSGCYMDTWAYFQVDARVLDLAGYDLILGMDWLKQHSSMTCD